MYVCELMFKVHVYYSTYVSVYACMCVLDFEFPIAWLT